LFWSPEIEALFNAGYEAVLKQWPVPFEELYIPTRFGDTHLIANGSKDTPALVLLHPAGGGSTKQRSSQMQTTVQDILLPI